MGRRGGLLVLGIAGALAVWSLTSSAASEAQRPPAPSVWGVQLALARPPTAAWPQLAYASTDSNGNAAFTWLGVQAGHLRVLTSRVHSGSEPSTASSLSAPRGDAANLTAAAAPGGDSTLAWLTPQPDGDELVVRTVARARFHGGLGSRRELTASSRCAVG
jgi:hypothetical protein